MNSKTVGDLECSMWKELPGNDKGTRREKGAGQHGQQALPPLPSHTLAAAAVGAAVAGGSQLHRNSSGVLSSHLLAKLLCSDHLQLVLCFSCYYYCLDGS
ncbi:hypothetical protein PAHAL_1G259500 [Panicum hallii]|uniref:Uncharacterized protein n=1 Tax=Panicum hallii TaxID=206008 RepID=A0A2S3GQ56_9POAL|nr:hypothetical protein PAHAL_1G259500 [Panicum hallii]